MWKELGREALGWLISWWVRRGLDELKKRTGIDVAERALDAELGAVAATAAAVAPAMDAAEQRGKQHPLGDGGINFEIIEDDPEK